MTGVQFASVLKNIYAMGAGIAHGLEYGDNFLSVFITNCFREMQEFLEKYEQFQAGSRQRSRRCTITTPAHTLATCW